MTLSSLGLEVSKRGEDYFLIIYNINNYKIYIALNLNKYSKALYKSIDKDVLEIIKRNQLM